MKLTETQLSEATRLVSAHNSIRYMLAKYGEASGLGLYLYDADGDSTQPHIGGGMGRTVLAIANALVEERLRELGVEVNTARDWECFECAGSGRRGIT